MVRSIPPVTACGRKRRGNMDDGLGGLFGGMNKFLQQLPELIKRLQEIQTKTEEARERGEDPRPIVQSGFSGHVLGQRIGSIPPGAGGGGQSSSQYGDDPKQHTDEHGAGYGGNRGAGGGVGSIRPSGKKAAPKQEKEVPIEHEAVDLALDVLDDQIVAEVPGVDLEHLTVKGDDGMLTVEGAGLHRTYSGSVELPADRRAGKHTLNNGVLVVKLLKRRKARKA